MQSIENQLHCCNTVNVSHWVIYTRKFLHALAVFMPTLGPKCANTTGVGI